MFIQRLFRIVVLFSLLPILSVFAATKERPNILFCLADDWSYPHAGVYGDQVVKTPTFDRLASEGMLFNYCFSAAPSCTPSRAAMLTGQYPHRLEEGSCLWGFLPKKFPVYPDLLEQSGYVVGSTGKGWAPGDFRAGGFTRNPAGPTFKNFAAFLQTVPAGKPFCFWFGTHDPHRPYKEGSGAAAGLDGSRVQRSANPTKFQVPPWWPDNEASRNDIMDYYASVQRFDRDTGEVLEELKAAGKLDNTIIVISGDNGWPFPRCKANVYDGGTRQPLAIRWPGKIKPGQTSEAFVNLADLAPTFLEVAGIKPRREMTGHSLLPLLQGGHAGKDRDVVYLERERHANVRPDSMGYPMRAVRTREYLYIRNLRPDRWPAGNPDPFKDPFRPFGDCDDGPTKRFIIDHQNDADMTNSFALCFGKRPAEELYDLHSDPWQTNNVAGQKKYSAVQKQQRNLLDQWMKSTSDPRFTRDDDHWDRYPYFGGRKTGPNAKAAAK